MVRTSRAQRRTWRLKRRRAGSTLLSPAVPRRGGRVVDRGGLLSRYTGLHLYPGFESLPLRSSLSSRAEELSKRGRPAFAVTCPPTSLRFARSIPTPRRLLGLRRGARVCSLRSHAGSSNPPPPTGGRRKRGISPEPLDNCACSTGSGEIWYFASLRSAKTDPCPSASTPHRYAMLRSAQALFTIARRAIVKGVAPKPVKPTSSAQPKRPPASSPLGAASAKADASDLHDVRSRAEESSKLGRPAVYRRYEAAPLAGLSSTAPRATPLSARWTLLRMATWLQSSTRSLVN